MRGCAWCYIAGFSYLRISIAIFFCIALSAEGKNFDNVSNNVVLNKNEVVSKTVDNRFDVASAKIAGISSNKGISQEFRKYSKFIERSWNRLYQESLKHIPAWTEKHLKEFSNRHDTLFYPFGGPDISYAVNFFPNVKRYILIGLEPVGNFEQIERNLSESGYYLAIQEALSTYLKKGYFVTSEMQSQLANANVKGGLNLILLALKRQGFNVIEVKNCSIDVDGNITTSSPNSIACVRILCEKSSEQKEIYYLRANLGNESKKLDNLINFAHKFEFSTLIKSASYALHDRNFSKLRSFILNNTNCILQDDTGVPFNFFRQNWDIRIFGTYTQPTLPVFHSYKQNSLSEYYSNHQAAPIQFPIGYGYIKRTPNLVFAISLKKTVERQLKELKKQLHKKKCNCNKGK